jgi:hydrogenase maturation protease
MRTIIIGIGNPVRSDDAVGLAVARTLREHLAADGEVEVAELPAGGLRLVEAMVGFDRAVVIDAMATGTVPPGTVRRLGPADLGKACNVTCVHDTSLPTALEIWRRSEVPVPDDISVWGIEAQDMTTVGEELTLPVGRAVPLVAKAILDDLRMPRRSES